MFKVFVVMFTQLKASVLRLEKHCGHYKYSTGKVRLSSGKETLCFRCLRLQKGLWCPAHVLHMRNIEKTGFLN